MSKKLEAMTVEELMAEADKLIRQFDSEIINDLEETQRSKLEEHFQNLKNIIRLSEKPKFLIWL